MRASLFGRRGFLSAGAFGLGAAALSSPVSASSRFLIPGSFAYELAATPRLTEGPFYPDKLPLDTDN